MLIQAFCQNIANVNRSARMVWNEFRSELDFIELSYMNNIKDGYYNIIPYESIEEMISNLDMKENDNAGVYYNEGRKIYVRIFRDAKINPDAYGP